MLTIRKVLGELGWLVTQGQNLKSGILKNHLLKHKPKKLFGSGGFKLDKLK